MTFSPRASAQPPSRGSTQSVPRGQVPVGQIALSTRAHDRVGHRRTDQAWLDEAWADPATRVIVLAGGRFQVTDDRAAVAWQPPQDSPPGQRIFLGESDGRLCFALLADAATGAGSDAGAELADDDSWAGFREVGAALSPGDAGLVVHAIALSEWHQAHRHCPRCGGSLRSGSAGHVLTCVECNRQQFPRTDPAVIMLVSDGDRALLARQPRWPEGRYSTLAGFVDPGESLEAAVVREVAEEVGVEVSDVSYFGNQPWPFPASLMVGFLARAVTTEVTVDGDEISDARWFSREDLRSHVEAGDVTLPGGMSISRALIEHWYGGPLPGQW